MCIRDRIARKTSYFIKLIEDFSYGKEIRLYHLKDWLVSKIEAHLMLSHEFYKKQTKEYNKSNYFSTLTGFVRDLFAYLYLSYRVIAGTIGSGDFTMYLAVSYTHLDVYKRQGALILPAVDIDKNGALLFGRDYVLEHHTFDANGMQFVYDEEKSGYIIPITGTTSAYTPKVVKIKNSVQQKRITVGYAAPDVYQRQGHGRG